MKASMSRSPLTHYNTRRSPLPFPTSVENANPSRLIPRNTHRHRDLPEQPERRQWPPSNRNFYLYDSPSSSSQDGKSSSGSSNSTSGGTGKSANGSETQEERRVRTVSPYGSFFAEEMESDTPAENNVGSFRQGDGHGQEQHDNNSLNGVFFPTRKVLSKNWTTRSQAQMQMQMQMAAAAPVFFATGYPTFASAVPVPDPDPDPGRYHDASSNNNMTEIPLSTLSLAENSRRSQPPLSWRQGYPDHPHRLQWDSNSQYDPHQVGTALPRDKRQTDARDARDGSRRQR
jgi:hypothetical protein